MRITRLKLDGFGILVDQQFEFEAGLNVILGPNEAGKTTLQQAILALLFGFYSGSRLAAPEKQVHSRFRPWTTNRYGGKLYLRLDNNTPILIARGFELQEPETHIYDTNTGKEITAQFVRKRRGYVNFAESALGLSRAVFEASACVQQGQLTRISDAEVQDITDTILRLVDSGTADVSVQKALDRISAAIRKLGSDRSRSGPIFEARAGLQRAEHLFDERNRLNQSLEADYLKLEELNQELERLQHKEHEIEKDIRLSEHQALQKLLQKLVELAEKKQAIEQQIEYLKGSKSIPISNRDVVIQLLTERKMLRQQRQKLFEEHRHLSNERKQTRQDLNELPPSPEFWTEERVEEYFELKRQWNGLKHTASALAKQQDELQRKLVEAGLDPDKEDDIKKVSSSILEELKSQEENYNRQKEELEETKETLERQKQQFNYLRLGVGLSLFILFLIFFLPGLAGDSNAPAILSKDVLHFLKYLGIMVGTLWISAEAAFLTHMRTQTANIKQAEKFLRVEANELNAFRMRFDVESVDELLLLRQKYLEFQNLNSKKVAQTESFQALKDQFLQWLKAFGMAHFTVENLARIDEMVQQHLKLQTYLRELNENVAEIEKQIAQKDSRLKANTERLQRILRSAGCWTNNIESDAANFFKKIEQARKHDTLMRDWDQVLALEHEMLAGRSIAEIQEHFKQLDAVVEKAGTPINMPPRYELEAMLVEVQNQLQPLQVEVAALRERIAERERQLPNLSEIEEEIAYHHASLNRLVAQRQALTLAFETLSELAQQVHNDFAPRLANIVSEHLAAITDGKYRKAYIDPTDFTLRVAVDATRELVPLPHFSFGTQEQIYLLLRAALAQLFSSGSESVPLFLDDPLAHADDRRKGAILESLQKIGKSQQLFYFTKDRGIVQILESLAAEFHLIVMEDGNQEFAPDWLSEEKEG